VGESDLGFGLPDGANWFAVFAPHEVVVEIAAAAQLLERVRVHEDRYGIRSFPYWVRYYHPHLAGEYESRMAELRATMLTLDDEARAHRRRGSPPSARRP
jgi:hypothetical protein